MRATVLVAMLGKILVKFLPSLHLYLCNVTTELVEESTIVCFMHATSRFSHANITAFFNHRFLACAAEPVDFREGHPFPRHFSNRHCSLCRAFARTRTTKPGIGCPAASVEPSNRYSKGCREEGPWWWRCYCGHGRLHSLWWKRPGHGRE